MCGNLNRKANRSSTCVLTAFVLHAHASWLGLQSLVLSLSLLSSTRSCHRCGHLNLQLIVLGSVVQVFSSSTLLLTPSPFLFDSTPFMSTCYSLEDCFSHFLDAEKSSFLPSLECHRLELADRLWITSSRSQMGLTLASLAETISPGGVATCNFRPSK